MSSSTSRERLVPLALLFAIAAISFAAPLFRKSQPTHPLVAAGIRLCIAAVILSPITIRAGYHGRLSGRFLKTATLAGLAYGVHFGAWVWSLTLTSVAASVTLVTTTPLLLGVAGFLTGRDRPRRSLWVALAVSLLGLAIIGGGDLVAGSGLLGDALAVLGAAGMAVYLVVGRTLGDSFDVPAYSGVATAVGGAALLLTAAVAGVPIRVASGDALLYIALAALLPQLVGHTLLTWSLRYTTPALVGMATVAEPVGATLIAWLWLGDAVSASTAIGCAVTLCAVVIALRRR